MDNFSNEQAIELVGTASITEDVAKGTLNDQEGTYEVVSVTEVKLAAKHKETSIYKVSKSLAILPADGSTYRNMVIESAKALGTQDEVAEKFEVATTFYSHTVCYPICKANKGGALYLYGLYTESSKPVYVMDGAVVSKDIVAEYLTPAEAKKLLGETKGGLTENKANGISHDVKPRTTKLENIKSITKV